jgi:flagellar biosynthesis/type III secretory pathway protein FliH
MNERVLHDPQPARKLRPEISAELQEILNRALERDPRHRYATAAEMAWDLEHQEQVGLEAGLEAGLEEGERRQLLRGRKRQGGRAMLLYAGLALLPVLLFGLMVALAGR